MRLTDKTRHRMLHALAHEICGEVHPDTQLLMTGWLTLEGEFLVSCAVHKMVADQMLRDTIEEQKRLDRESRT